MKKFLIIAGLIILIGLIVFLFYYWRSSQQAATPSTTVNVSGGSTQTSGPAVSFGLTSQKSGLAAQNPALDYFVDSQNNIFLIQLGGQVVKISKGQTTTLSSSTVAGLIRASFSYDGRKILAVVGNQTANQTSVFDIGKNTWQVLLAEVQNPVWAPSSLEIAYLASGQNVSKLKIWDLGDSKAKPKGLISLHQNSLQLGWLDQGNILLSEKPSALTASSVWVFNIKKKTLAPFIQDQPGLETIWSYGTSTQGLMFTANPNQQGGRLSLIKSFDQQAQQLNFLTLVSKCLFRLKTTTSSAPAPNSPSSSALSIVSPPQIKIAQTKPVFDCAVPRDNQKMSLAVLPDDYQKKILFTSDDFSETDLADGSQKIIFQDPSQNFDAGDLKVFNNQLFFINRFDQKIYFFSLAQ